ncbi:unnamed protein product [Pedinophyceae sp. YPF-701]|nr:unnamed protein product [Pedinophyceae sp. YPF-701]
MGDMGRQDKLCRALAGSAVRLHDALNRAAGTALPEGIAFHLARSQESFRTKVAQLQGSITDALAAACQHACQGTSAAAQNEGIRDALAADPEDAYAEFIEPAIDHCLDRTEAALQDSKARGAAASAAAGARHMGTSAWGLGAPLARSDAGPAVDMRNVLTVKGVKPQLYFHDKVDNASRAWVPRTWRDLATGTVHAAPPDGDSGAVPAEYQDAIDALDYPGHLLRCAEPQPPQPEVTTPLAFVDTEEQLAECAAHLAAQPEIAVDLEHHDLRSFQGFTCLIQVSSRTRDFVIDALVLRHAIPSALGPVFEDPKIVKVLHGADMDVKWLQRDFGIWIVTLFDTGIAARVLQQRPGLAAVMQDVCGVQLNKAYQRADWRLRPIPEVMLDYARSDTHSLLYVYDVLRRRLLDTQPSEVPEALRVEEWPGGVKCAGAAGPPRGRHDAPGMLGAFATVLERSRQLSLRMYKAPMFGPGAWRQEYRRGLAQGEGALDGGQRTTFRMLYEWRDTVARSEDESLGFIMPRAALFVLARRQPTTGDAVQGALRQGRSYAARNATAVAQVVRESMSEPPDDWPPSGAPSDGRNSPPPDGQGKPGWTVSGGPLPATDAPAKDAAPPGIGAAVAMAAGKAAQAAAAAAAAMVTSAAGAAAARTGGEGAGGSEPELNQGAAPPPVPTFAPPPSEKAAGGVAVKVGGVKIARKAPSAAAAFGKSAKTTSAVAGTQRPVMTLPFSLTGSSKPAPSASATPGAPTAAGDPPADDAAKSAPEAAADVRAWMQAVRAERADGASGDDSAAEDGHAAPDAAGQGGGDAEGNADGVVAAQKAGTAGLAGTEYLPVPLAKQGRRRGGEPVRVDDAVERAVGLGREESATRAAKRAKITPFDYAAAEAEGGAEGGRGRGRGRGRGGGGAGAGRGRGRGREGGGKRAAFNPYKSLGEELDKANRKAGKRSGGAKKLGSHRSMGFG